MIQARVWKPSTVCGMLLVLLLLLAGAVAQAQPVAGKAKVDRLVMGLITALFGLYAPVDQWHSGP